MQKEEPLKCDKCGSTELKPLKTWPMKNPKTDSTTEVTQYLCRECGKKKRSARTIAKPSKE